MRKASGRIMQVQEGRFTLAAEDGRVLQFVLSHRAAAEPQDLWPVHAAGLRVRVDYDDSPHLLAGVAHRISVEG